MNRKEYMERLWMDLQDLDHSTAEEIIQDFEHHFEQGRKEGRSEEEIARELGDPSSLLDELKTSEKTTIREQVFHPQQEIRKLIIDAQCANVLLKAAKGSQVQVDFDDHRSPLGIQNFNLETVQRDEVFEIRVEPRKRKFPLLSLSDLHLQVAVPESVRDVVVRTTSGDGTIADLSQLDSLGIRSQSGDLKLSGLTVHSLIAQTTSGDVEMEEMEVELIQIRGVSGDLTLNEVNGSLGQLKTVSGDVETTNARLTALLAESKSGDLELQLSGSEKLRCVTISGDVKLQLHECSGCDCEFKAVSGDFIDRRRSFVRQGNHYLQGDESLRVAVSTVSGDLKVEC